MAKAAKSKKTPKRRPARPAAKPKKATRAAKSAKSKAAPKRKTAARGKAAAKSKPAKRTSAKRTSPNRTVAKAAPKRTPTPARKAPPKPKAAPKAARPAPAKSGGASPRFESAPGFVVAGLTGRYSPTNNHEIPQLWQRFSPHQFGKIPGQVGEKTYGVCYNFDDQGNFDYAAAVEVDSAAGVPTELTQISIPPGKYAVFAHNGHISAISKTWMDIYQNWLPKSGRKPAKAPSFEVYSEDFDMDRPGGVEIWIPLEG